MAIKKTSWRDVSCTIDGVEYRPYRHWSLDLPISGDLYDRDPPVTRESRLPGSFTLGLALAVVGSFDRQVGGAQLERALDEHSVVPTG